MRRLQRQFDLGWLEIQILFDESGDGDSHCSTVCDWQYRRAVFTWNNVRSAILDDEELELVAIHELVHPLIEPIWDAHPDKAETAVIKVGRAVYMENVARVISTPSQKNKGE